MATNVAPEWAQYAFDPSAFNIPTTGGKSSGGGGGFNAMNFMMGQDPVTGFNPFDPMGIVGGLFGSDKPDWRAYVDEAGNYVWADPRRRNPVPLAQTPGATLKPSKTYQQMAQQIQAITDLLPLYSKAVAGQIIPNAQAQLEALRVTQPGYQELARQAAVDQVGTDAAALESARTSLIPQALEAAKLYDPEYFSTRELASKRLAELLTDIQLGSGLTDVERREVEQGLAQYGTRRGTYNAPSNLETVSNAIQYGEAGNARKQQNRGNLSSALALATSSLPAFKSGTDVFQVATGKPSGPNFGAAGVQSAVNSSTGAGTSLGGNLNQLQQTNNQLALTRELNTKDWADYLNQVTASIGNITGSVGGIAGMACWIARKVIPNHWKEFRHWLLYYAPESLRSFYISKGESIAENLTPAQITQLQPIMMRILNYV